MHIIQMKIVASSRSSQRLVEPTGASICNLLEASVGWTRLIADFHAFIVSGFFFEHKTKVGVASRRLKQLSTRRLNALFHWNRIKT